MELIGAGLQHADHIAAVHVAVGGGRVRGQHLDFLQRFRRGTVGDEVVERLVHVDAVQRVVVRLGAIAVHIGRIAVEGAPFNDALYRMCRRY